MHKLLATVVLSTQIDADISADASRHYAALIWDDTEAMPLLSDEYYESGDESLAWECEPVEHYPEPDHSVKQLKKEQAAFRVCRGLIEAYQRGEASGGSIDWEDLDQLLPLALKALDKKTLAT